MQGQKSFKDDTNYIITHLVCPIGPYEACTLCMQIRWDILMIDLTATFDKVNHQILLDAFRFKF